MKDVSIRISHGLWSVIRKLAKRDRRTVKGTIESIVFERLAMNHINSNKELIKNDNRSPKK